jgi:hypothetical protein
MGAWGDGPFDNDDAADWCAELNDAAPAERAELVRGALADAADQHDYLDSDIAARAVAAAAVVAAQSPGAPILDDVYGPQFLADGVPLAGGDHLRDLALRALERIAGDDSEWRELWEENGDGVAAKILAPLRTALTPS